jgi:GNAT superfamily N-acetyltransferase
MEEITIADLSLSSHAEAVVFLLNEYAKDEMGGKHPLSKFVTDNLVIELRKRPGAHLVLAFTEGKPIGLVICFEGFSTFACKPLLNIHDVVVLPGYRGRGISQKLLSKVEQVAYSLGCCKLTLEVLEGNAAARAAYESFGFSGYALSAETGNAIFLQKPFQP